MFVSWGANLAPGLVKGIGFLTVKEAEDVLLAIVFINITDFAVAAGNVYVFLWLAGLIAVARGAQGAGLIVEVKPERDDPRHDRVRRLIGFPLVMGTSQQFKN